MPQTSDPSAIYIALDDSRCDRIIFGGIALVTAVVPAVGSAAPVLARSLFVMMVFGLALLWSVTRLFLPGRGRTRRIDWVSAPLNLPLILFLTLMLVQIVPFPPSILALFSPQSLAVKQDAYVLLADTAPGIAPNAGWICTAYDQDAVAGEWLELSAAAALFFLVLHTVRSREQINLLLSILIASVLLGTAVFRGAVSGGSGSTGAVSFIPVSGIPSVRPALPGSLIMVFFLLIGFLHEQVWIRRHRSGTARSSNLRGWLVDALSGGLRESKWLWACLAGLLLACGLSVSAPPAVFTATGISILGMAGMMGFRKDLKKYGLVAVAWGMALIGCGLIVTVIQGNSDLRSGSRPGFAGIVDPALVRMVYEHPVLGVGAGGAGNLYPRYVASTSLSPAGTHPISGWLAVGAATGLPGVGMLFAGWCLFLSRMLWIWRTRGNPHAVGIGSAVLAGMLAIGVYGLFDTPITDARDVLALAVSAAAGYTAIHRRGEGYRERVFYPLREIGLSGGRGLFVAIAVSIVFTGAGILAVRYTAAEWLSTGGNGQNRMLKAAQLNPSSSRYHLALAKDAIETEQLDLVVHYGAKAAWLNPACGRCWHVLGGALSRKKADPFDYLHRSLPLADRCFDMAAVWSPADTALLFDTAAYWVRRSRIFPEERERNAGIEKFQRLFRTVITLDEARWEDAVDAVASSYEDERIVMDIIPVEKAILKTRVLRRLSEAGP